MKVKTYSKESNFKAKVCSSFIFTAEALLGVDSMFFLPFAKFHRYIEKAISFSDKIWHVIALPRGYGKSKLAALFAAWSVLVDKRNYVVIVSYNEAKATQILRDIKRILMHPKILAFFGHRQGPTDGATVKNFIMKDGREVTLQAMGAKSPGIGLSEGESRPDIYILDDLENPDQPKNPEILPTIEENINVKYYYGLSRRDRFGRHGKILYIGTMHYAGCILETTLKKPNAFTLVLPQEIIPETINIVGRDVIGGSIWLDLYSDEDVKEEREAAIADGSFHSYSAQKLMAPLTEGSFRFDEKKRKTMGYREAMEKANEGKIVTLIDMAYSDKSWADYVGITTHLILPNSRWITLEASRNKFNDEVFFEELVRIKNTYKHFTFMGFYAETLQILPINAFLREYSIRKKENIFLNHLTQIPGLSPTERIRSLVAYHDSGLWIMCYDTCGPLFSDMQNWKGMKLRGGVDDVLDSSSWVPHMFKTESDSSELSGMNEEERRAREILEMKDIIGIAGNANQLEFNEVMTIYRKIEQEEEDFYEAV